MPSYRPPRQDAERLRLERERVAAERGRAAERKMREQRPRVRRGERPPWQDDLGSDALESDAKFSDAVRSDAADGDRSRWTVDVHSHVYLPRYIQMLRDRGSVPRIQTIDGQDRLLILPDEDKGTSTGARARAMPLSHLASSHPPTLRPTCSAAKGRPIGDEYWSLDRKLAFMDTHHIGASVLSTANPWLDFVGDRREAVELSAALNDDMQAACAASAGRLYGFGVLPLGVADGAGDACAAELKRLAAMRHMRGVIIGTRALDDPAKDPMWRAAEESGLTVFVHPHYGLGSAAEMGTDYGHSMLLALGFPFDTSAAIARLVLSGVLDRFPKLKILAAHSGGTLPYLAGRLDSCVMHDAHMAHRLKRKPSEYLRELYYDAISYHRPTLDAVAAFAGADRLMFGTDHPFFSPLEGKDDAATRWASVDLNYAAMDHLDAATRDGVRYANARRILNLYE